MPVLLRGNNLHSFFILLLIAGTAQGQIPLNGFCVYNRYPVHSGYTSLLTVNYNDDAYTDLILYGGNSSLDLYKGIKGGAFSEEKTITLSSPPHLIINMRQKSFSGEKLYVLTPVKRKGEIAVVTPSAQFYIQHTTPLKEFPKFAVSDDLNGDDFADVLLSGINASGIGVYMGDGRVFKRHTVNKGESFQYITTLDWTNDGFPDAVAYEPFKQSIYLFSNNSRGNFRFERALSAGMSVTGIHSYDMNLDGYQDIIVKSPGKITIYYGDSAGAFLKKSEFAAGYKDISKIVIGDYNRDGFIDIITLSSVSGRVSALFQREDDTFFPPVMLFSDSSITDIANFYSRFVDGIALLDSSGYIHTITRGGSPADQVSLVPGGKPAALASFDQGQNGIRDFMYIDSDVTALKILLRDKSGVPSLLYSAPLSFLPDGIIISDIDPEIKKILLHKKGERFFELVTFSTTRGIRRTSTHYVDGIIEDLRFVRIGENSEIALIHSRGSTYRYVRYGLGQERPEKTFETELGVGLTKAMADARGNVYMIKNSGFVSEIQFRGYGSGNESSRMLYRIESRLILPGSFYMTPLAGQAGEAISGLVLDDDEHVFVVVNENLRIQISNRRASEAAARKIKQKPYVPRTKNPGYIQTFFMTGYPSEIVILNLYINPVKSLARKYRRAVEMQDYIITELKETQPYFIHSTRSGLLNFRRL